MNRHISREDLEEFRNNLMLLSSETSFIDIETKLTDLNVETVFDTFVNKLTHDILSNYDGEFHGNITQQLNWRESNVFSTPQTSIRTPQGSNLNGTISFNESDLTGDLVSINNGDIRVNPGSYLCYLTCIGDAPIRINIEIRTRSTNQLLLANFVDNQNSMRNDRMSMFEEQAFVFIQPEDLYVVSTTSGDYANKVSFFVNFRKLPSSTTLAQVKLMSKINSY